MRILHLHLSREFAGSERYAASLAALQAQAGHQVAVLVRGGAFVARWRAEASPAAVLVIPTWAIGPLGPWVARSYAKGHAPDVLHSHLGKAHKLGNWLAKSLNKPHVGTVHLRYKPKEHEACTALIAIAKWQLAEMPAAIAAKTTVVWNWLPRLNDGTKPSQPKAIPFTFGSVGRLHPQKNMLGLVQAFQAAFPIQTTPKVALEIVGEGPERPALAKACAADPRIRLLGYQNDVAACYQRWHAYVSASRHEPFGLTILEAMSHQLPLVCTKTEGPTEFLNGSPNTHWAELGSQGSLGAALQACYSAGPQTGVWDLKPFDPARALGQIVGVYERVRA